MGAKINRDPKGSDKLHKREKNAIFAFDLLFEREATFL
jgi:hypothetical protein